MTRPSRKSDAVDAIVQLFWLVVALDSISCGYAILSARDLVYDGSYYLLGIATHADFQFFEPARRTIECFQQIFAVAGGRLGLHNLWTLGQLLSLGCSGWPVVLTVLCWFALPATRKVWIVGPLVNLVFAIPAANFIGISETITASCLLWLTLFMVAFRLGKNWGAVAGVIAACLSAFSHESAIVFLILVALTAAWRLKGANRTERISAIAVIVVSTLASLNMLRWILVPRSAIERGDFLRSVLGGFVGSPSAPNLPALASIAAALAIIVAISLPKRSGVIAAGISITLFVAALLLLLFLPDATIVPSRFFAARALPLAVSSLLAAAFLWAQFREGALLRFATVPVIAVVAGLAVFQFLAQIILTANWTSYARDLSTLVATRVGGVSHDDAMRALDSTGNRFRRELLESWSVEPLSIMLAPHGRVQAVVLAAPWARWVPYQLNEFETFPRTPGLDWSPFCHGRVCARR